MTWRPSDPRFQSGLHSGWYWEILQSGISVARSDSLWRESLVGRNRPDGQAIRVNRLLGPEGSRCRPLAQQIVGNEAATAVQSRDRLPISSAMSRLDD